MKAVNYRAIPLSLDFEADSPPSVGEVMREYPEVPDLRGVGDMGPDAGAGIVIAYADYPKCVRHILRQLAQVHYRTGLRQRNELNSDRQAGCDYLVDLVLDGLDLFRGGTLRQQIVAFALLALDIERGQPNIRTIVWLRICSAVCIGGYSSLLCALSWISSIALGL